jgi:hypothetical protein
MTKASNGSSDLIAAVITDGAAAVHVARSAARIAGQRAAPLLLLVPMPRPAFTTDAAIVARQHRTAVHQAQAIVARARPTLAAHDVSFTWQMVWHHKWPGGAAAASVRAARRASATVLVSPAHLPSRARFSGGIVLVDSSRYLPPRRYGLYADGQGTSYAEPAVEERYR